MCDQLALDQVKKDKKIVVVKIEGGWRVRQRLNQMGVHPNDLILVKRSSAMGGPILIQIHGSEIAIGRGMAKKIIVKDVQ